MADIVTAEILAICMGTHILDSHLPGFLMGTYLIILLNVVVIAVVNEFMNVAAITLQVS